MIKMNKTILEERIKYCIGMGSITNKELMDVIYLSEGELDKNAFYREIDKALQRLKKKGKIVHGWSLVK